MIVADAAENRGFSKKRMSNIGWGVWSSHQTKTTPNAIATGEHAEHARAPPAELRRLDDAVENQGQRHDRQPGANQVEP